VPSGVASAAELQHKGFADLRAGKHRRDLLDSLASSWPASLPVVRVFRYFLLVD
jgi:hypothetical protein